MKFTPPTYEEYAKATKFAKLRYKFGVYIQLIAAILLIFLLFYTITNIEEMKAEPISYAEEKRGVVCFPPLNIETPNYNGSIGNIRSIKEG